MIGKWIMIDDGEYCLTGRVTDIVGVDHFLVRMCPPKCPTYSRLYSVDDLAREPVMIFDDEAALNNFMAWADTPPDESRPKIVNIKK